MKFTKAIVAAAALSFIGVTAQAQTLEAVKSRGHVLCGVSQGLPGFSNPDDKGNWTGIDVDVCRAVGVAIFGSDGKVKYVPLSAKERFTALQSGEIDVLSRNTTWTFTRDNSLGLEFVGVNYYDGQGFMVPKSLGVKSAKELSGAAVCTNTGTTTELNVADYFRGNKMEYKVVAFEKADEVVSAYDAGRCDVYTTDRSGLAAQRTKLKNPDDHIVLPEIISKEPLGPAVRHGDSQWGDIVRWSLNTMIIAEELGVHSGNVDEMKGSDNPEIKRMLGMEANFGEQIGLGQDFAYNIIKYVGNYAQSYNAHVGPKTPLKLDRGLNALWNNGGILYAPPFR
ncbi:MAG: amino acid ABC transporter substrate-binding protein [Alphaproteobacteria bacterium]|nr:amino acid ABC transporter substrate-binding protein [Alphaproteobacteria bacterium]